MPQIGDTVRFLNSTGGGQIVKIEGRLAYVDEDGFETPVLLNECVVVTPAAPKASGATKLSAEPKVVSTPKVDAATKPKAPAIEETPQGELLNIVLAYEPRDIRHISTTDYDTYLVNDSNYFLYFTYLTRADRQDWTTRYAGIVEPGMQVCLERLTRDMVGDIERIAVQYIAFKQDSEFKLKSPGAVEYAVDNTKFFKLHCFHSNPYFDTPVIAFDIVKDDCIVRPMTIDSDRLADAMTRPKAADRKPVKSQQQPKKNQRPDIIEVDLHIHELLDTTAGLSNADMLEVQLSEVNRVMAEHIAHHGTKIVFIHGKGEGVLRSALLKELRHRYKTCQVQDASFREYGFGATQVTIR